MAPLLKCVFFGVLALFRSEVAKGAKLPSGEDNLEGGSSTSSPPDAGAVGGVEEWSERGVGPAASASGAPPGESMVASPAHFVDEQFKFLDTEEAGQPSTSPGASSVVLSLGWRHSLFPQCWLTEREKRENPEAEENKCRVDPFIAVPPSRHPLQTVESARSTHLPFSMQMPPWNAVVAQARSATGSTSVWHLEILHQLLWLQSGNARKALEHFTPTSGNVQALLFELLSLAEALFYVEGSQQFSHAFWYLELEAAVQVARNTFDQLLQLLEQVLRPELPESEGGICTTAPGDSDPQSEREPPSDDESGDEARTGSAKEAGAAAIAPEEEAASRSRLVRRASSSKILEWARHMTVAATEVARSAADTMQQKTPLLLSDADVLSLRLLTTRIWDLLEVRQKPLPVPYTAAGQAAPARLFGFPYVQAPTLSIPCKARSQRRRTIINVLNGLIRSTLSVTSQRASQPRTIYEFVLLLTRLSKSIRATLEERHRVPKAWTLQVDELLAHAYVRLELLLSQRVVFMKELPYQ